GQLACAGRARRLGRDAVVYDRRHRRDFEHEVPEVVVQHAGHGAHVVVADVHRGEARGDDVVDDDAFGIEIVRTHYHAAAHGPDRRVRAVVPNDLCLAEVVRRPDYDRVV